VVQDIKAKIVRAAKRPDGDTEKQKLTDLKGGEEEHASREEPEEKEEGSLEFQNSG
jgi:hypothetical protein